MIATNTAGDLVKGSFQAWFGIDAGNKPGYPAPAIRLRRPRLASAVGQTALQSSFFNNMLQDMLNMLGGHLGNKPEELKTVQGQHMEQLVAQAAVQCGHTTVLEEVRRDITEIQAARLAAEARIADIELHLRQAESTASSPNASTMQDDQDPCLYLIANSGWDTTDVDLMDRAKSVLSKANVSSDQYHQLVAIANREPPGRQRRGVVQGAEGRPALAHVDPRQFGHLRLRPRRLGGRPQRPSRHRNARQVHRLPDEEYEADRKQQRMIVTKRTQSLPILVGGQRAAYFRDGELRFTSGARERHSHAERATAMGFSSH